MLPVRLRRRPQDTLPTIRCAASAAEPGGICWDCEPPR